MIYFLSWFTLNFLTNIVKVTENAHNYYYKYADYGVEFELGNADIVRTSHTEDLILAQIFL